VGAIKKAKAVSTGKVQSVFVEDITGGTASAFGVVNESVTNTSTPNPRTEVVRLEVELIDTSQGWRVSRLTIFQAPTGGSLPSGAERSYQLSVPGSPLKGPTMSSVTHPP